MNIVFILIYLAVGYVWSIINFTFGISMLNKIKDRKQSDFFFWTPYSAFNIGFQVIFWPAFVIVNVHSAITTIMYLNYLKENK